MSWKGCNHAHEKPQKTYVSTRVRIRQNTAFHAQGAMMHEHRTTDGKTIYYAPRHELEALPGYKGHGDKYRAGCPIHGGDSYSAFQIDYKTGWGYCFKCGDAWGLRVEDHPDTKLPKDHPAYAPTGRKQNAPPPTLESLKRDRNIPKQQTGPLRGLGAPQTGDTPEMVSTHQKQAQGRLQAQIPAAMAALPGSPGAAYLKARGIDIATAQALELGWSTRGDLAGRVILPLRAPDGVPIGATGRTIRDGHNPKYKALAAGKGYLPGLFNGGAVSQAIRTGHPLLIVEGPLDAAAAYAAGYPLTVGIGSTSYKRWEHFAGVPRVILFLDNDAAGTKARAGVYASLQALVPDVRVLTPAAQAMILEGAKDLGEYWQEHRRMPPILGAMLTGPYQLQGPPLQAQENDHPMEGKSPHGRPENRNPMEAPKPHGDYSIAGGLADGNGKAMGDRQGHELTPAGDAPMQSESSHALPRVELTHAAVLDLFPQLDYALQIEAYELLERLQNRKFAVDFRRDFYGTYSTLDTADRVACLWALVYHPADALEQWRRHGRAA